MLEPTGSTSFYIKYKVLESDEWVEKNLIISQWQIMDFMYSKIQSQEMESLEPVVTIDLNLDKNT